MRIVDMDAHPPLFPFEKNFIGVMDAHVFFERIHHAGVDLCCGIPFFDHQIPMTEGFLKSINDFSLKTANRYAESYKAAITIHPQFARLSCSMIEAGHNQKAGLIGELVPEWLENDEYHHALGDILKCAGDNELPIAVRVGKKEDVVSFAEMYPEQKLLILFSEKNSVQPHEIAFLIDQYPNIVMSLSHAIMTANYIFHSLISRGSADRFVFGSGYPLHNPVNRKACIDWELRDQNTEVREAIYAGNAFNLMHCSRPDKKEAQTYDE